MIFSNTAWSLLISSACDFASSQVLHLQYSATLSEREDFNNNVSDFESQMICQLSSLKFLTHPNGNDAASPIPLSFFIDVPDNLTGTKVPFKPGFNKTAFYLCSTCYKAPHGTASLMIGFCPSLRFYTLCERQTDTMLLIG